MNDHENGDFLMINYFVYVMCGTSMVAMVEKSWAIIKFYFQITLCQQSNVSSSHEFELCYVLTST
jgi:hypothetical protein